MSVTPYHQAGNLLYGKLKVFNESQDCRLRPLSVQNWRTLIPFTLKGGDPAAPSGTATLLRLHPPYRAYLRQWPPEKVSLLTSGTPDSGGVTGGVYKARERIHRAMLMRDY